ncbi:hypothetical protein [Bradyrhizobium cosmicum]|nr:hypothetical protein [Bradyrhizobium cosmicum]
MSANTRAGESRHDLAQFLLNETVASTHEILKLHQVNETVSD